MFYLKCKKILKMTLKFKNGLFLCVATISCQLANSASITYSGGAFDFIDNLFSSGYSGLVGETAGTDTIRSSAPTLTSSSNTQNGVIFNKTFDVFDWNTGGLGSDGNNDVEVVVTTTGLGTAADYRSALFVNGTGFGSKAGARKSGASAGIISNPVPTSGTAGVAGAVFGGLPELSQTIEIRFLSGIELTVSNLADFSVSSANTSVSNSAAWEYSTLELLDSGYMPFTSAGSSYSYTEEGDSLGYIGAGTYVANGDTLDDVGTSNVNGDVGGEDFDDSPEIDGADSSNSSLSGNRLYGVRYSQSLTDTRGVNNGTFGYTATINDLQFSTLEIVPEPTSSLLLGLSVFAFLGKRNRK